MVEWKGVFTILVSALTREGGVDEGGMRASVDWVVGQGVHGVIALGSVGEFPYLSPEEKREIIDVVVDEVNGRVPVLVGTSHWGTDETVGLSRYARDAGADGFMINLPAYFQLGDDEIYGHYEAVSAEVDAPFLLYNIPSATHLELTPERVVRLAEIENVVGIKETIQDLEQIGEVIRRVRKRPFSVFAGMSSIFLKVLELGGAGVIDPRSNIYPETLTGVYQAFEAGDLEKARRIYGRLRDYAPLFKIIKGADIAGIKEIMRLMGRPIQPTVKRPLPQLTGDQRRLLREQMQKMGLARVA